MQPPVASVEALTAEPVDAPAAIEAHRLGWRTGKRWILRELDLRVDGAALVGIAGRNGAGKSALLRLLAALEAPTLGYVRIEGYETTLCPAEVRRRVGYLPPRAAVYDRLSVAQNLDFVARSHGLSDATRAEVVRTLLDVVGLAAEARTMAGTLSPGQRRRAALAASLVHDPPVLLLDDPLRGLDGAARLEQGEVLRELRGMGKTVVLASNLLADLASLCDEIVVLRDGTLAWHGTPSELSVEAEVDGLAAYDHLLADLLASGVKARGQE